MYLKPTFWPEEVTERQREQVFSIFCTCYVCTVEHYSFIDFGINTKIPVRNKIICSFSSSCVLNDFILVALTQIYNKLLKPLSSN